MDSEVVEVDMGRNVEITVGEEAIEAGAGAARVEAGAEDEELE